MSILSNVVYSSMNYRCTPSGIEYLHLLICEVNSAFFNKFYLSDY